MADPLIGREEELNAVRAFLSTHRDGPGLVLLEGEAGIGKTAVWEAVIAAEEPRWQVLRARPAEAEMALSFAGLSDLLGGVLDAALPGLPAPQRRALEVALLLEPGGKSPPERRAVATVALSDRERIAGLTRLQATQSIFFAMTELCKGKPASREPARAAVQAVRQGKYQANLGAP